MWDKVLRPVVKFVNDDAEQILECVDRLRITACPEKFGKDIVYTSPQGPSSLITGRVMNAPALLRRVIGF